MIGTAAIFLLTSCSLINMSRIKNFGATSLSKDVVIIPFELKHNHIYIKAGINNSEKKYNFIFDTGAATTIDEGFAESIGVQKKGNLPTPDDSQMYIGRLKNLTFDGLEVKNPWIMITNSFDSFSGDTVGFIGSNLMQYFVVTIDYDKQELILRKNKLELRNSNPVTKAKIETHPVMKWPLIETELVGEKTLSTKAMIDVGMPNVIVLPISYKDKLYNKNSNALIKSNGVFMKWPFWHTDTNYISRLEKIKIGDLELNNVLAYYANTGGNVLLGKSFLDKFCTHIDYIREEVLLEQFHELNYPDNIYTTGLYVNKVEDRIFVKSVLYGTSAFKMNIKPGDEIIEFNSEIVSKCNVNQIINRIMKGTDNEILIKLSSEENEIVLKRNYLFEDNK